MTFGDSAVELARLAAALLGWRPGEFWDATPAELATALGANSSAGGDLDASAVARLRAQFPDDRD